MVLDLVPALPATARKSFAAAFREAADRLEDAA
jgi:hypothetical protein